MAMGEAVGGGSAEKKLESGLAMAEDRPTPLPMEPSQDQNLKQSSVSQAASNAYVDVRLHEIV